MRTRYGWINPGPNASEFEKLVDELGHCHFVIEGAQLDPCFEGPELVPLYEWRDTILYDLKTYRR